MINKNKLLGRLAEAGYTQKELAHKIGVSPNTLSNKMNGKTQFKTNEIDAICDKLKIKNNMEKTEIFLSQTSQ